MKNSHAIRFRAAYGIVLKNTLIGQDVILFGSTWLLELWEFHETKKNSHAQYILESREFYETVSKNTLIDQYVILFGYL
jgi:hypothetical protein